ncbi:MAG: hypothetical protein WEC00_00850 [Dongiaceae bacterium]
MPPLLRATIFGFDVARAGALLFALVLAGACTLVFFPATFLIAVLRFAAFFAVLCFADFAAVLCFADFFAVLRFADFAAVLRFALRAVLGFADFFAVLRLAVVFLALALVLRAIVESPCLKPVFLKPGFLLAAESLHSARLCPEWPAGK